MLPYAFLGSVLDFRKPPQLCREQSFPETLQDPRQASNPSFETTEATKLYLGIQKPYRSLGLDPMIEGSYNLLFYRVWEVQVRRTVARPSIYSLESYYGFYYNLRKIL